MSRNKIACIFLFIPTFLFLQGCEVPKGPVDPVYPKIPPYTPHLYSPPNNATDVTLPVILIWYNDQNAISYSLQVSDDSQFVNIVYDTNSIATNTKQINGLSYSSRYYWRVSARNNYGTSPWSTPVWSFHTCVNSCLGTPTVQYEGRIYNTISIGRQCWLKENINVGTMLQGNDTLKDNGIVEKYCYDDDTANCNIYGGLYKWSEAMQYTTEESTKGICPTGWHIPAYMEFYQLIVEVHGDGNALKAIGQGMSDGTGTNSSGFSALLAGLQSTGGRYLDLGNYACYWSSTERWYGSGHRFKLSSGNSQITDDIVSEEYGFSIRCIKD